MCIFYLLIDCRENENRREERCENNTLLSLSLKACAAELLSLKNKMNEAVVFSNFFHSNNTNGLFFHHHKIFIDERYC